MKSRMLIISMVLVSGALLAAQGMMGGAYGGGYGGGYGMMGGSYGGGPGGYGGGYGMMGGAYGGGMMGNWDYIPPDAQKPLTLDQAANQAKRYLASWGDENLELSEVMEFSNHFYIQVAEKSSANKAFELLMNKYTGAVFPEPGPNMMWNQKYGPMSGGSMGFASGRVNSSADPASMPVSEAKARELAQTYLDSVNSGLKAENGADRFYGYYTLHVLKDGKVIGMLGVDGYSGQVWYHSWHGAFIDMKQYGAM